ncbi:NAD/FAD-binding protein [Metarhizium robertsii]|uniref:Monooxygenase n=2 Tax=Metarhizium robertsii TaxID=568076 RepID=E9EY76_METRA|nr:Monooxygenase [Metarhizium robertsii ARSEF 23]EFZ00047.1 Monooxygenase [Metarhizium robertsii ARSEF 23]EXV06750.1 NAD/FAD-binding protein [Metarhizium robertsii]
MNQRQRQGEATDGSSRKSRVAIIGTGLAGLTTAYLVHHDGRKRYGVTLFEQADTLSLDAASITLSNAKTGKNERVDVPPRSFCKGYYNNLCRMYEHLGIGFQRIRLIWVYTKASATSQYEPPPEPRDAETIPDSYFVYNRRLHELLLLSPNFWHSSLRQILQTFYLAICHMWFFVACFLLQPWMSQSEPYSDVDADTKPSSDSETFHHYLQRIRLPRQYAVYYLLPVLSIICSCSHAEMMDFPASDVVDFVKGSFFRKTFVPQGGVNRVQSTLSKGVEDVRLGARVTQVTRVDQGMLVRWEQAKDGRSSSSEEIFDRVVLAVSPNVAATIFSPSRSTLGVIPTAPVTSSILAPPSGGVSLARGEGQTPSGECSYRGGDAQIMEFRTAFHGGTAQSESFHFLPSGVVIRTSPSACIAESKGSLHTSKFTRTLRTTRSRSMVQRVMGKDTSAHGSEDVWVNGKDNVWIVGSWCWDGLVLLEGCVVSAMKVAEDFGVSIPWSEKQ